MRGPAVEAGRKSDQKEVVAEEKTTKKKKLDSQGRKKSGAHAAAINRALVGTCLIFPHSTGSETEPAGPNRRERDGQIKCPGLMTRLASLCTPMCQKVMGFQTLGDKVISGIRNRQTSSVQLIKFHPYLLKNFFMLETRSSD